MHLSVVILSLALGCVSAARKNVPTHGVSSADSDKDLQTSGAGNYAGLYQPMGGLMPRFTQYDASPYAQYTQPQSGYASTSGSEYVTVGTKKPAKKAVKSSVVQFIARDDSHSSGKKASKTVVLADFSRSEAKQADSKSSPYTSFVARSSKSGGAYRSSNVRFIAQEEKTSGQVVLAESRSRGQQQQQQQTYGGFMEDPVSTPSQPMSYPLASGVYESRVERDLTREQKEKESAHALVRVMDFVQRLEARLDKLEGRAVEDEQEDGAEEEQGGDDEEQGGDEEEEEEQGGDSGEAKKDE